MIRLCLIFVALFLACPAQAQSKADATLNVALAAELAEIDELDQGGRAVWQTLQESYDGPVPDSIRVPFWTALERVDAANFVRLDSIVAAHGWPGQTLAGEDGARTAFLVIQHAPLKAQERYLAVLEAAVSGGEAEPWQLAMLTDRVLVRRGLPQRYGSQFRVDLETGERTYDPVEDPTNLNARREAIGLPPHRYVGAQ